MEPLKGACFDVYYYGDFAKASCVVFQANPHERIISEYYNITKGVYEYISGEFYRRELPCILEVYKTVKEKVDFFIVDGFVTLEGTRHGLGGFLFEAFDRKVPVIGVAKTLFMGCADFSRLYRGRSINPLYITSIGISLNYAMGLIRELNGDNRIPKLLKRVDRLSRS